MAYARRSYDRRKEGYMHFKLSYLGIKPKKEYEDIIEKTLIKCYEEECIDKEKIYIDITLTNNENIRKMNNQYRNIDNSTDVLSFPMFNKQDFPLNLEKVDILGDIVISIEKIKTQAVEYGNTFEQELSYMVIHSFYHLLGYDHENEQDKKEMREKERKLSKNG